MRSGPPRRWDSRVTSLVGLGATGAALLLASCQERGVPESEELALVSDRGGDALEIYLTAMDTSFYLNLSNHEGTEYSLTWKPDGSELLFRAYWDGASGHYAVRPDGSGLRRIGSDSMASGRGAWSPDGSEIAYSTRRDGGESELYVMTAEGEPLRRLTRNELMDDGPAWSPDGDWIAFTRFFPSEDTADSADASGNGELFLVRADGSGERQLTFDEGTYNGLPAWSPTGDELAYHRCVQGSCTILIMDPQTGSRRALVADTFDNRWPEWSPDGAWIAYTTVREGQTDIWLVRPDGSEGHPLIDRPGRDEIAVWRPTGG